MHLAITPEKFSIRIDDRSRVVINTRAALLKKRSDDDDFKLQRQVCLTNRLSVPVFLRPAQSWRDLPIGRNTASGKAPADKQSARLAWRRRECRDRLGEIFLRLGFAPHLHERDLGSSVRHSLGVILCHVERSRDISQYLNDKRFLDYVGMTRTGVLLGMTRKGRLTSPNRPGRL